MSETKICNKCKEELPLDRFGFTKKPGGKKYMRNVCKSCHNQQRNKPYKQSTTKDKGFIIDGDSKPEYTINKKRNDYSMFNEDEIKALKNIAKYNNELMGILNNRIDFEKIEDIKVKKSITISKSHHEKILEIVKNHNGNYSQVLDNLLKKALENV